MPLDSLLNLIHKVVDLAHGRFDFDNWIKQTSRTNDLLSDLMIGSFKLIIARSRGGADGVRRHEFFELLEVEWTVI